MKIDRFPRPTYVVLQSIREEGFETALGALKSLRGQLPEGVGGPPRATSGAVRDGPGALPGRSRGAPGVSGMPPQASRSSGHETTTLDVRISSILDRFWADTNPILVRFGVDVGANDVPNA